MKLNRTGANWDRLERNKINENWDIIEGLDGKVDNIVDEISDEAFEQIVDSAKLDWKEPVDSFNDLPSSASEGDARMVRDTGKVYRFDGTGWKEIQDIDPSASNEVDNRLTQQLAQIGVCVKYPPTPLICAKGDNLTDDTTAINSIFQYAYDNGFTSVFI